MKKLIILTAIPGAGKSTWANQFILNNKNSYIVSSDEIRKEIGGSYQYFKEEDRVWKLFLERTHSYAKLDDVNVILDSTNLNDYYRMMYLNETPDFDKHVLVYLDCPYELALKRNFARHDEKIVPLEAMEKMKNLFEVPSDKIIKLFDEYLIVKER
jgi:tRNA uridine 5-carbamoylmethylation protein Kti12